MSDATIEQKLQLVRQVRSRYDENQYDLSNRERLLYGKTSYRPSSFYQRQDSLRRTYAEGPDFADGSIPSGSFSALFKIRFLLALLLLVLIIMMDKNDLNVAGITSEKIYEMISADYEEKIGEWLETM